MEQCFPNTPWGCWSAFDAASEVPLTTVPRPQEPCGLATVVRSRTIVGGFRPDTRLTVGTVVLLTGCVEGVFVSITVPWDVVMTLSTWQWFFHSSKTSIRYLSSPLWNVDIYSMYVPIGITNPLTIPSNKFLYRSIYLNILRSYYPPAKWLTHS